MKHTTSVDLASWTSLVGTSQQAGDRWAALVGRWSEPHRRYHGIGHLSAVLMFVDEYEHHAADPDAVRLAAWYHDAIYDPRANDNEERSAALATNELGALGLSTQVIDEVVRLVRLTIGHDPADGDRNGAVLTDADLLVLASPPEAYVAYVNAVREEYAHVSDADFRTGRAAVLDGLSAAHRIYRLPELAPLEAHARRNLAAELSLLRPVQPAGPRADPGDGGQGDAAADAADPRGSGPTGPPAR